MFRLKYFHIQYQKTNFCARFEPPMTSSFDKNNFAKTSVMMTSATRQPFFYYGYGE